MPRPKAYDTAFRSKSRKRRRDQDRADQWEHSGFAQLHCQDVPEARASMIGDAQCNLKGHESILKCNLGTRGAKYWIEMRSSAAGETIELTPFTFEGSPRFFLIDYRRQIG